MILIFIIKKSTLLQFPKFQGCSVTITETYDSKITQQQCFHRNLLMVEFILGWILINCLRSGIQVHENMKSQQKITIQRIH